MRVICLSPSPPIEVPNALPYLCTQLAGHDGDHACELDDGVVNWPRKTDEGEQA